MPRGRWMFVLFERHVGECVYSLEEHEREGWFKGKRGNVVRLYREDVGVFVSKVRRRRRRRRRRWRWVNAGHKMKIKGRRRFIYGEISGRGRFNDLVIRLVRLEDVVEREEDVEEGRQE